MTFVYLRWLLVLPSAIIGWYIVLFVGVGAHTSLVELCPDEYFNSRYFCTDMPRWYLERILTTFFAGISAVVVIVLPFLLAPTLKKQIATLSLVGGVGVAAVFLVVSELEYLPEFASALFAGCGTYYFLTRKNLGKSPNKSLERALK